MKSAYVKPIMMFEGFQPTEYVAACYYSNYTCKANGWYVPAISSTTPHECNGVIPTFKDNNEHPYTYSSVTNMSRPGKGINSWGTLIEYVLEYLDAYNRWTGSKEKQDQFNLEWDPQYDNGYLVNGHVSPDPVSSSSNSSY